MNESLTSSVGRATKTTYLLATAAATLLVLAGEGTFADVARTELHLLETTTLTDQQFLAGTRDGRPATIAAELRLPSWDTAKVPAIVMMQGPVDSSPRTIGGLATSTISA